MLEALLRIVERSGAKLRCSARALSIERLEPSADVPAGFVVRILDEMISAQRVILAVGGCSYPGCGTTGDGYSIAQKFGHTIVEPRPALVPLKVVADWVPTLRGLSVPDAVASVVAGTRMLERRREAVLFTHRGLSGPAILDVSRAVARREHSEAIALQLDFLPDVSREDLDRQLQFASRQGRRR